MKQFKTPAELQSALRSVGYFTDDSMARKIWLAMHYRGKGLSTIMLDGVAGSGKTFLVETLASIFNAKLEYYQCVATTSEEALIGDIDVSAVVARDSSRALRKGKLVRAIENTVDGLSFLFIDELDKARPEMDAFLLDFLQSGRLTGTPFGDLHVASTDNIIVFLAKNDERDVSEPLARRCRYIHIEAPSPRLALDILTKRVPEADKAMLTWIIKLYAVMSANMADLRKVMTIQEMENALLDDILVGNLSTEERIENVITWAAQYEDDLNLVRKWATKIPFGDTNIHIEERQNKSIVAIGGEIGQPNLIERLTALENRVFSGDDNDGYYNGYNNDEDEYDNDAENISVNSLLFKEGDYIDYESRCRKVLKIRPNGSYIDLVLEDTTTGEVKQCSYVDPATIDVWTGEIPEYQGFFQTLIPNTEPIIADEPDELDGIPAGRIDMKQGERLRNSAHVKLIADNVFRIGHYTAWRREDGWQVMWDGHLLESKAEIELLEITNEALFAVDISWVEIDRRLLAHEWGGRLATYGKDGFVVIPNNSHGLGHSPERVLITRDRMVIKMGYSKAPRGLKMFLSLFDDIKSGKVMPEWSADTKEVKIGNLPVELDAKMSEDYKNKLIDVYVYSGFLDYKVTSAWRLDGILKQSKNGSIILNDSLETVQSKIDEIKRETPRMSIKVIASGVVKEYERHYVVVEWELIELEA